MIKIIPDLSNEAYHHQAPYSEYLSSSQLKWYAKSPRYARYMMDNPQEETAAMKFGSLFHSLMEKCAFSDESFSVVYDDWSAGVGVFEPPVNEKTGLPYGSNTKAYTQHYEQFLAENKGNMIATAEDLKQIFLMTESLLTKCGRTSRQVRKLFKYIKSTEISYLYENEDGIKLKIRPDAITKNKIIDYKTCSLDSLDEESIARQIIKYRYDVSLSMYQYVMHKITGRWYKPYLIFVSKIEPYECVICDLSNWCYYFTDEEDDPIVGMGVGAKEFVKLLNLHTQCMKNNEWPGVENSIIADNKIMEPEIPWWFEKKYFTE